MTDEVQFSQILKDGGVSQVEAILAGLAAGRATIDANIEDAAKAGVFGAPSFVVDGELYFGNDRLIFLEQALTT